MIVTIFVSALKFSLVGPADNLSGRRKGGRNCPDFVGKPIPSVQ